MSLAAAPHVFLVAGEDSGDRLGAALIAAIKRRSPGARFSGVGGAQMAGQGLASLFPLGDLAIIGFAAMTPFFHVGTLYEGAAAKALGGADISFFVGLPLAGILYYVFSRSIDVAAETRVARAEAAELERAAAEHRLP